jgi:hypothetical protein
MLPRGPTPSRNPSHPLQTRQRFSPLGHPPSPQTCAPVPPEPLADVTPESVDACSQWVMDNVKARGTTDIMAPLQRAMRFLQVGPVLRSSPGWGVAWGFLARLAPAGSRGWPDLHAGVVRPPPAVPPFTQIPPWPAYPGPALPAPSPDATVHGRRARAALHLPYHRRLRRERAGHLPVRAKLRGRASAAADQEGPGFGRAEARPKRETLMGNGWGLAMGSQAGA